MTDKTYRRLVQLGVELAQEGYTVILDAKFDRQALRGMAIDQAQRQGIPLRILHRHVNMPLSLPSLSGLWPAEANCVAIGQGFRPNFYRYFGKGSLHNKSCCHPLAQKRQNPSC